MMFHFEKAFGMNKYLVFGLGSILEYDARSTEHAEFLLSQDFPDLDVLSGSIVVILESVARSNDALLCL